MFGFGNAKRLDSLLSILRAENSDLRQTLREERSSWARERQELVDRIVALASPAVLREMRRGAAAQPADRPLTPAPPPADKWRPNFPGMDQPYDDPPSKEDGDRILDKIVADLKSEGNGRT
jgi:hypothetical protein